MNLEELIILFIPKVVFFHGVKLSKVALPCSSTNKKVKATTMNWKWRLLKSVVCVDEGGGASLLILVSKAVRSHKLRWRTWWTASGNRYRTARGRRCWSSPARVRPAPGLRRLATAPAWWALVDSRWVPLRVGPLWSLFAWRSCYLFAQIRIEKRLLDMNTCICVYVLRKIQFSKYMWN